MWSSDARTTGLRTRMTNRRADQGRHERSELRARWLVWASGMSTASALRVARRCGAALSAAICLPFMWIACGNGQVSPGAIASTSAASDGPRVPADGHCSILMSASDGDCGSGDACCVSSALDARPVSDVGTASDSNESGPAEPGATCLDSGGACVFGGGMCVLLAPSADQDCNPQNNPAGAFCCLDRG